MVDSPLTDGTQTLEYKFFRGLNKRDDENNLQLGQTPDAQNFDIVRQTGLKKKDGFTALFEEFDTSFSFIRAYNHRYVDGSPFYIAVNYPHIYLINRINGASFTIGSLLNGVGDPFFIPLITGQTMMVDGVNAPRLIVNSTVTSAVWPPNYAAANSTKLNESANAVAANPTALGVDIGYPSFGTYYENRVWLSGDNVAPNRIYVTKAFDFTAFGANSGATWDIAFFVDVPSNSPITALKVINDKFLVIYCEREIFVVTGKFPPASGFPSPPFQISSLNPYVGCLGPRLVVEQGNNDHFFVGNNGVIYNLVSLQNFQDVKPTGLSSKVFPLLEGIDNETFKRGLLVNHKIKGEVHFWYPSENYLAYPDKRLVYSYSDSQEEGDEWSIDTDFGDFYLQDSFLDDETSDLIILTPRKFLNGSEGLTYDGAPIDTFYQLSTLDFGDPDVRKEILECTLYVTNRGSTPTTVYLYHLWETGQASGQPIEVPPSSLSTFNNAQYNTSVYSSFAGTSFNKVSFQLSNKHGKILKAKIQHSEAADIFIHSIIFRWKPLGK
jgi:hypothetical protein